MDYFIKSKGHRPPPSPPATSLPVSHEQS